MEQAHRNDGKYNEEDMKFDIYLVIYMTKVTTVTVGEVKVPAITRVLASDMKIC